MGTKINVFHVSNLKLTEYFSSSCEVNHICHQVFKTVSGFFPTLPSSSVDSNRKHTTL